MGVWGVVRRGGGGGGGVGGGGSTPSSGPKKVEGGGEGVEFSEKEASQNFAPAHVWSVVGTYVRLLTCVHI